MSIIQFKEANCKNCYKCIRNCDLKAISCHDEQARVIEQDCVLCGKCTLVCPQNAKQIKSDVPEIKQFIEGGAKVMVSLAPSYVAAFPGVSFAKLSKAIKKLGFARVEETAIGATRVSEEYARLCEEGRMKNIITTCCPTGVMLIEKYYPQLIPQLAPVLSPASAHARMLRELYGNRTKVVFAGPCISKKAEAEDTPGMNAVLMFEELRNWFKEEGIDLNEDDNEPAEMHQTLSRLYPVPGGIIRTVPTDRRRPYKSISVDGLDRCIQVLDSLQNDNLEGYFIELSACAGSCVQGPGLHSFHTPFLTSRELLFSNAAKKTRTPPPMTEDTVLPLSATHSHTRVRDKLPDEKTIEAILASIGKTSEEKRLNCSTCGYATCRDKAIAVFQGKADLKMCLPYMREKAESLSNLIIENTPNGIFLLDSDLHILEFNPMAAKIFKHQVRHGDHVYEYLNPDGFNAVNSGKPVYEARAGTADGQLMVQQSIVKVDNGDYLVIIRDITDNEEDRRAMAALRSETIETAQKVIDKQMRVAQEIASLLGETTGETKAALTQLKKSIEQGERL